MKRGWLFGIFLLVGLFLVGFIFAAHTITTSSGTSSFSVDEDTANLFNITVNNTDAGAEANITSVNITLPSGASCTFVDASNGTSIGSNNTPVADSFTNSSNSLIWTNTTGYVINGTEYKYFWFNATCTEPGTYNITVYTTNVTGIYSSNLSLEVNDTTPFNVTECQNLTKQGIYLLNNDVNSSGTCFNVLNSSVLLDCQGYSINFSEGIVNKYGIRCDNQNNITIKNCVINQGNVSIQPHAGIHLYNSQNSTIYNNTVRISNSSGTIAEGFFIRACKKINISFNDIDIFGPDLVYGIYSYSGSNDSIVRGNNITTNSSDSVSAGLVLGVSSAPDYTYRSNVTDNRFTSYGSDANGGLAIAVGGSDNLIYNNIFNSSNSSYIAFSSLTPWFSFENLTNNLNISKTVGTNIIGRNYFGGNYWTNPTSSGYSDYCTNLDSDYICDSYYRLDSNNIDYFPLTNHINTSLSLSSSSSSGSGNSYTGFWKGTHAISNEQFREGYTKKLAERERIRVPINNEEHHIGIVEITDITAKINVSSDPIQVILSIGQDASFDIDDDGIYDIHVLLNSIENLRANITIQETTEVKDEGEEGNIKTEGEIVNGVNDENIIEEKNYNWIYWTIGIIVVLLILWFVFRKRR